MTERLQGQPQGQARGSVVFLGSGVGGLPYIEYARSLLPGTPLHYLADDAGFPYGTKTPLQIEDLLIERTRRLKARLLPSAFVIACNTASQIGLSTLRAIHPDLPIVGTVPAVKPAAASTQNGRIGVIATERAVADPFLDDLIVRYAPDIEVVKLAAQDLVYFVENRLLTAGEAERMAAVEPYVRSFIASGVDRIVLACTHFLHLEKEFSACCLRLGAVNIQIVDSRQGVANRIAKLAQDLGIAPCLDGDSGISCQGAPSGRFLLTGEPPFDPRYSLWASRFGLGLPERL
jgi:glutamate racemase